MIQRWADGAWGDPITEDPSGELVTYEDHVKEVERLESAYIELAKRTMKLELFVQDQANQRTAAELQPEEYKDADFEGAWDSLIYLARTLRKQP